MKRLLILVLVSLFYSSFAWAGACDTTITEDHGNSTLSCADNDELTVNEGITFERDANYVINANSDDNVKVTNYGTIRSSNRNHVLYFINGEDATIDNKSTGTIYSYKCCAINYKDRTGTINIYNAGTIQSRTHGTITAWDSGSPTLNIENSGTITMSGTSVNSSNTGALCAICATGSSGTVTITNTGTVQTSGNNNPAIYVEDSATNTITNSGTISGHGSAKDIKIWNGAGTTTTTININRGATWNKGIDLGNTNSKIVLGSDNNRDVTVTIYNHDNLTIENNTGTNGYALTTEDLDSGGSSNDGTLTIYGENLEVDKKNQKYRAENTLTKIRGLFGAANYLGGQWPDNCTTVDPEKTDIEPNETCNNRFFKLFHSYQKRDGVYDGTSTGIVGMLSPIEWKGYPIISNLFIGYSNQEGDFDNGEYLGGDNFVLGLKNVYEHKGFKASFTPMIGVNDLDVKDYDTDKVEVKATDFLSEFAALNGKINKKIGTGEDNYLNISVEGTFGLQRFPEYISKFTDGDLSVDESIEQLLSGGFQVSYTESLPGNFIIKPYFGVNLNRNLNDEIKVTAKNESNNVTNSSQETWSGYHAGFSLTKKAKDINFDLDLMYGNEDGLINQVAAVSLTKSFGASKTKDTSKKSTKDLQIASINIDENLLEFGKLKEINKQIKAQNAKLKAENEKLKSLYAKTIEENKTSKRLIVELLKENEKIKLEKEIFKNKLLEIENKELKEEIESAVADKGVNKFLVLLFVTVLILFAYGITSLIISIFQSSFRKSH